MTEITLPEEIAGARAYEELHVPALFREWAPKVLDAVALQAGEGVLDVACGTGVVVREAMDRVGKDGQVVGLDASAGMLSVARELAPRGEFHRGLADSMPFADESFDVVVCQFGLMFFQDRVAAIHEMLRVLAPGGRLGVVVWESLERSEAYPDEVALIENLAGPQAADAMRAPFVLGDVVELRSLFQSAGVKSIEVSTQRGKARFPSIRVMVEADLRGWLPVMGVHLSEQLIQNILGEAESVMQPYRKSGGNVEFAAPAHIVSCVKT